MALWRLTLDVPYNFAVSPGYTRSVHSGDFRQTKGAATNTFRDQLTGLVMLKPSFLRRDFATDFKTSDQWRLQQEFWAVVKRGHDASNNPALMMTTYKPKTLAAELIEIETNIAIAKIEADLLKADTLVWALESKFQIEPDEGFCLYYHNLSDELQRKNNWFGVQWDDCFLHFTSAGICYVHQYVDRANMGSTPALVHEFEFANPGEILNKTGYFYILPVPGYGILLYHSRTPQKGGLFNSNADAGGTRGHLIPWPARQVGDHIRLFERSPVRIALNYFQQNVIGFQNITFSGTGTFLDDVFDPGFKPATAHMVAANTLNTGNGSVTATLRKADNSADFEQGVDQQGRVLLTLDYGADVKHTPFVYAYGVAWDPDFATRDTTPVPIYSSAADVPDGQPYIDRLLGLHFALDEMGRFEGEATLLLQSDEALAVANTGDSTFQLEYSLDGGDTWVTVAGGFATEWDIDVQIDNAGLYYECHVSLRDLWQRFEECHQLVDTAFDGLTVGDAINVMLRGASEPPVASMPPEAEAVTLPPPVAGQHWKFAPREGDEGAQVVEKLLLFLRKQNQEFRLRHDWPSGDWLIEERPRNSTAGWALVARAESSESLGSGALRMESLKLKPESPEMNIIRVFGVTDSDPRKAQIVSSAELTNPDSITDKTSVDYLGRAKIVQTKIVGLSDQETTNRFARVVFDASAHRAMTGTAKYPYFDPDILPSTIGNIRDENGDLLFSLWAKRVAVTVEQNGIEQSTVDLSSIWTGDLKNE